MMLVCDGAKMIGSEAFLCIWGDGDDTAGCELMLGCAAASLEVALKPTAISLFPLQRLSVAAPPPRRFRRSLYAPPRRRVACTGISPLPISTTTTALPATRCTAISPFELERHSCADDVHGDFAVPNFLCFLSHRTHGDFAVDGIV